MSLIIFRVNKMTSAGVLCLQTGRIQKNFKCSNYENPRIIRTRNYLIRFILKPLTWYLERATMSLRGSCRRIREGYGLVLGISHSAYCNDNKERGSQKTTVSTRLRTVGNFTWNRGLPTSRLSLQQAEQPTPQTSPYIPLGFFGNSLEVTLLLIQDTTELTGVRGNYLCV